MDHAVALVETYLRVNGYLTVTEYPVVEAMKHVGFRTATDLDDAAQLACVQPAAVQAQPGW